MIRIHSNKQVGKREREEERKKKRERKTQCNEGLPSKFGQFRSKITQHNQELRMAPLPVLDHERRHN